jgi:hypothetical protein
MTLYREMWRLVECPVCHVPPGKACQDDDGERSPDDPQHPERIESYKRIHDA